LPSSFSSVSFGRCAIAARHDMPPRSQVCRSKHRSSFKQHAIAFAASSPTPLPRPPNCRC
jgi:hypothetical protein